MKYKFTTISIIALSVFTALYAWIAFEIHAYLQLHPECEIFKILLGLEITFVLGSVLCIAYIGLLVWMFWKIHHTSININEVIKECIED